MNHKEFQEWINDHKDVKAPGNTDSFIMELNKPKGIGYFIKPLTLTLTSFILLLVLSINLTDYFYVMAQGTPLEGIINVFRVHDKWMDEQEHAGHFIKIEDKNFASKSLLSSFMIDNNTIVLKIMSESFIDNDKAVSVTLESSKTKISTYSAFEDDLIRDYHYTYTTFDNPITIGDKITFGYGDLKYDYIIKESDITTNHISLDETIKTKGNSIIIESIDIGNAFSTLKIKNNLENSYDFVTVKVNLLLDSGQKIESGNAVFDEHSYNVYFEHGGIENFKVEAIEINYISWLDPDNRTITFDPSTQLFDKHNDILKFIGFEADTMKISYDNISQFDPSNPINPQNETRVGYRDYTKELLIGIKGLTAENFETFGNIEFYSYIPDISDSTYHKIFIPKK